MARAEKDGEERHAGSYAQRKSHIVNALETPLPELGSAGHSLDGGCHGLQLERDVRRYAYNSDASDEDCKAVGLAKAGGQEVGERGDALLVADADEAAQEKPPADED
jgi:hypothetical protein